jgi:hypothetical protein
MRECLWRSLSKRAASELTRKSDAFVNRALNNQENFLSIERKVDQIHDEFTVNRPVSKYFWLLLLETICYTRLQHKIRINW